MLDHLDIYLETYEAKVKATGGHVHWAETPDDARAAVLEICRKANAKMVTKGKSMVSEEIELEHYLKKHGVETLETDLGEFILPYEAVRTARDPDALVLEFLQSTYEAAAERVPVVVDLHATGHALSLLATPHAVRESTSSLNQRKKARKPAAR